MVSFTPPAVFRLRNTPVAGRQPLSPRLKSTDTSVNGAGAGRFSSSRS
jgi:hypothetical protein